ncbi:MAG: acyl-ACP--UDP-N-acetylglucosamine O-acyltransferase [Polyangiaceae bacterium]|nr:acyl-ACP--UDP-N-acetylglucosamine O-acyltransferase [Polyangiaceae bacterium]MCW5789628.1 acyl-ACP--UDP-N-acetylglucosamine O-acyltransferase [Polyangiaceae bacterium]
MSWVHPQAVVESGAELAEGVRVGPFCYVEAGAKLGPRCELVSHVVVRRGVSLGPDNQLYPFAVLGGPPQDRSYAGEACSVVVGAGNVFRESTTVHAGTAKGDAVTRVGDGGLFMVGAHVAHDCQVGDRVILTNYVSLGGHVVVEEGAVLGGHVAVAPFCRVGSLSFTAGGSMIERDVPPFVTAAGDRARVRGVNRVGLRRAAVPEPSVRALIRAERQLFHGAEPLQVAAKRLAQETSDPYVARLVESVIRAAR